MTPLPPQAGAALANLFENLAKRNGRAPVTITAPNYEPGFYALAEADDMTVRVDGVDVLSIAVVDGIVELRHLDDAGQVITVWKLRPRTEQALGA